MAHFAELDENNIVTRVIVVHNNELIDDEGNDDYKKLKTTKKIEAGQELTLKYGLYDICDYL